MNEWFNKLISDLKEKWAKWSIIQKVILIGIVLAVIIAIVCGFKFSSKPTYVRLFSTPVTGTDLQRISNRLDRENIPFNIDDAGFINIENPKDVTYARSILIQENLVPATVDPFANYFDRGWSTTDADQNVKKQLAITQTVKNHIESINEISNAEVVLVLPEDKLFRSQQEPVSASVILTFAFNSDIPNNYNKIRGIENIVLSAVQGLKKENLMIADSEGNILNDDAHRAHLDRLTLTEREQNFIQRLETKYRAQILKSLQGIHTEDRIRDLNIKINMNMNEKNLERVEHRPFVKKEDNPDTPYDDSIIQDSVVESSQTVTREWQGTGFNPQGPTGVEGQNPPVYSDMSNVIGRQTETGVTQNFLVNTDNISETYHPTIDRVTVSLNVDGKWEKQRDKNGNVLLDEQGRITRTYIPVPEDELNKIASLVEGAIGFDRAKNYRVVVTNIQIDRSAQFEAEDEAIRRARQTRMTIILVLIGLATVLLVFILYRFISRELERRRRLKAEEERRRQEAARLEALRLAENEGMEVTMSVEERRRAELQENAIAMAKEHPEDVAMLIRTWLMEE